MHAPSIDYACRASSSPGPSALLGTSSPPPASNGFAAVTSLCHSLSEFVELYAAGPACIFYRGHGIVVANGLFTAECRSRVLHDLDDGQCDSSGIDDDRIHHQNDADAATGANYSNLEGVASVKLAASGSVDGGVLGGSIPAGATRGDTASPSTTSDTWSYTPLRNPPGLTICLGYVNKPYRTETVLQTPTAASPAKSTGSASVVAKDGNLVVNDHLLPSVTFRSRCIETGISSGDNASLESPSVALQRNEQPPGCQAQHVVVHDIFRFPPATHVREQQERPESYTHVVEDEVNLSAPSRSVTKQGPRAEAWLERWTELEVPGVEREVQREHVQLIRSTDWSQTPLGPMDAWPDLLFTCIGSLLAAPHAVALVYGPGLTREWTFTEAASQLGCLCHVLTNCETLNMLCRRTSVLYNIGYAKNIAGKHPRIFGMNILAAWPEIQSDLKPQIREALSGRSVSIDNGQLFLHRGDYLEECYFSWSMSPIYNESRSIVGVSSEPDSDRRCLCATPIINASRLRCTILVPHFDNSNIVVAERRMRLLRETVQTIAVSSTPNTLFRAICHAVAHEPGDIPLLLFYDCSAASDDLESSQKSTHETSAGASEAVDERRPRFLQSIEAQSRDHQRASMPSKVPSETASAPPLNASSRRQLLSVAGGSDGFQPANSTANLGDEGRGLYLNFVRAAMVGCSENSRLFPQEVPPKDPAAGTNDAIHPTMLRCFRKVQDTHEQCILQKAETADLVEHIDKTALGDAISCIVFIPIVTMDGHLRAVAIMGLNPRKAYSDNYQAFIDLFRSQVSHGITSTRLISEEVRRSQLFAALVKRKNEELHQLLDARAKELRSSDLRFLKLTEVCPAGIYTSNLSGEITFVNEAWWKLSGHPRDSHPSDWLQSIVEEDHQVAREAWAEVLSGTPNVAEFRWNRRPGEQFHRWAQAMSTCELDENGTMVAVLGVVTDITSSKRIEEREKARAEEAIQLRRQQERFIDMTSHEMRNPLSAICLSAEASAERLEALMASHVSNAATASWRREMKDTLSDLKIINHCCVHMSRLIDDVLTLSKLDNHFLVITPVPCRPADFISETLSVFKNEMVSKDITCELEILPTFSQMKVDHVLTDPSRINQILINCITNAIKFTAQAAVRRIKVTLSVAPNRPLLPGTAVQGPSGPNAEEPLATPVASPEDPTGTDDVYLICSIADTGRGLTPHEIAGLFQRFKQANAKTHIAYGGSGLGLFICRRIVELLGGEIGVESVRGAGSTFTFYTPTKRCASPTPVTTMSSPGLMTSTESYQTSYFSNAGMPQPSLPTHASGASTPQSETAPSPEKMHILIVEDNLVNQRLMDKNLARAGCVTACANHGQEAIDKIRQSRWVRREGARIDCVLMDIEMPVLDGLSAIKIIRRMQDENEIKGHIPVLAVSANARDEQISTMIESGFDAVVSKPFKILTLLERVQVLLEKFRDLRDKSSSAMLE